LVSSSLSLYAPCASVASFVAGTTPSPRSKSVPKALLSFRKAHREAVNSSYTPFAFFALLVVTVKSKEFLKASNSVFVPPHTPRSSFTGSIFTFGILFSILIALFTVSSSFLRNRFKPSFAYSGRFQKAIPIFLTSTPVLSTTVLNTPIIVSDTPSIVVPTVAAIAWNHLENTFTR
jgi:hypothetical protein